MITIKTAFFTGVLTVVCGVTAIKVVFDSPEERRAFRQSEHYFPVTCDGECDPYDPPDYEPPVHTVPVPATLPLLAAGLVLIHWLRRKR